ncbi:NAD(P)H-dependent oxidoreductase [Streptomyces sp. NPDC057474]|uniref:NAD(P)H-dependent oxidoreductase n=1 Tax=Streptomyces sp. NPDC057474 TaxID=3346144 RepID=UPI0036CB6DCE
MTVLVGNPKAKSRTRTVAEAVARRVAETAGAHLGDTIDLSDHAENLFAWQHEGLDALVDRVAASDLLVVASPTYKATYTGLLKAFLDRYGDDGLSGVTALGVMTGGSAHHALAVDTTLRSLLVELGASVPTRGLYFITSQLEQLDAVVETWAERHLVPGGPLGRAARSGGTR